MAHGVAPGRTNRAVSTERSLSVSWSRRCTLAAPHANGRFVLSVHSSVTSVRFYVSISRGRVSPSARYRAVAHTHDTRVRISYINRIFVAWCIFYDYVPTFDLAIYLRGGARRRAATARRVSPDSSLLSVSQKTERARCNVNVTLTGTFSAHSRHGRRVYCIALSYIRRIISCIIMQISAFNIDLRISRPSSAHVDRRVGPSASRPRYVHVARLCPATPVRRHDIIIRHLS
jgi:hypothetical protein